MDTRVQLVFFGEVLSGFDLDAVKRDLGRLLQLDDTRLARLFGGSRTVIKRSIAPDEAQRYVKRLAQLGAHVRIEPVAEVPAGATPAVSPPAASPVPEAVTRAAPQVAMVPPGEEEMVCPHCGERQSRRILCRACSTDMPMGIAARLEAEQEARAARLAEARARRGLRDPALAASDAGAPPMWGFGFSGRMARLPYATASVLLLTVMFLLVVFALQRPGVGRTVFAAAGFLLAFGLSMRLAVLRCHDCNRHGWWSLFLFVPYAGFVASLVLSLMPGSPDDNDYGGHPRQGRWLHLVLALAGMALAMALTVSTVVKLIERATVAEQEEQPGPDAGLDQLLGSSGAAQAFRHEYALAPSHKAFAVSSSGSWGFRHGASTMRDAMQDALEQCEAHRQPYTPPCELINVNGQWAGRE